MKFFRRLKRARERAKARAVRKPFLVMYAMIANSAELADAMEPAAYFVAVRSFNRACESVIVHKGGHLASGPRDLRVGTLAVWPMEAVPGQEPFAYASEILMQAGWSLSLSNPDMPPPQLVVSLASGPCIVTLKGRFATDLFGFPAGRVVVKQDDIPRVSHGVFLTDEAVLRGTPPSVGTRIREDLWFVPATPRLFPDDPADAVGTGDAPSSLTDMPDDALPRMLFSDGLMPFERRAVERCLEDADEPTVVIPSRIPVRRDYTGAGVYIYLGRGDAMGTLEPPMRRGSAILLSHPELKHGAMVHLGVSGDDLVEIEFVSICGLWPSASRGWRFESCTHGGG